ncbi:divalent-cation tolerance protein CutA [Vibrio scophthalmi]|uniref:divalent-cation tolerance protein CutA n=1 Tax=Vibrio scophthalmi TaxID=45658 RepID=UPI002FF18542
MEFCIALTTTNSQALTERIIDALLEERLAACIQTMPIESHYVWQEQVCRDNETLLVIKTTQSNYVEVEQKVVELHDYDTPQVVQVPIVDGFNPYLSWLEANTRR